MKNPLKGAALDEGLAGLLAGLVGAGIGGMATAYGARIGGQKTLEAALTQVERQEVAEHRHWVREQRRQACGEVLDSYAAFSMPAHHVVALITGGQSLTSEELDPFSEAIGDLIISTGRLHLWGPRELAEEGRAISQGVERMHQFAMLWNATSRLADQEELLDSQELVREQMAVVGRAMGVFARVARRTLAGAH